jgi:hypothetical protein
LKKKEIDAGFQPRITGHKNINYPRPFSAYITARTDPRGVTGYAGAIVKGKAGTAQRNPESDPSPIP